MRLLQPSSTLRRFAKAHTPRWALHCLVVLAFGMGAPLIAFAQQVDSARAALRPPADSARRPGGATRVQPPRDSLAPPISPGRAFLLSFAVPGLGQARLNRPTAGAVYITAEAVWLAMLAKSANDLRIAKARAGDVIVDRYAVDPTTGRPLFGADGQPQVADTIRSRYAEPVATGGIGSSDAQQRSRVKARRLHLEDWVAMLIFNHLFSGADAFVSAQLWDLPAQVEMRTLPQGAGLGVSMRFR